MMMIEKNPLKLVLWQKTKRARHGLFGNVSVKGIDVTVGENYTKYFSKKSAEIYYDRENRTIGLKPVDSGAYGYSVFYNGRAKSMTSIRMVALIAYLKIKPDWYKAQWDEKNRMLLFKYEEKGEQE